MGGIKVLTGPVRGSSKLLNVFQNPFAYSCVPSHRSRHNQDSSTFRSRTQKSPRPQPRSPLSRRPR